MPPKRKRKGKGKSKGKVKDKGKSKRKNTGKKSGGGGNGETRMLLKTYEKNCAQTNSQMCPGIKKLLTAVAGEDKVVTKFIMETVLLEKESDLPVLFDPFITSLRQERYKHVRDIHVWDYPLSYENIATLALFLEKPHYAIRTLELLDCLIDALSIIRLAKTFNNCDFLTTLVLDYNEFRYEGCQNLCKGLEGNKIMLSLSLCYCDLKVDSGKYLGHIVSTTAIRELYLDGNELQCEGTLELIKLCVDQAEIEAYQREEEAKRKAEEEALKAEQEKLHQFDGIKSGDTSESEKDLKSGKTTTGSGKGKKLKKGKGKKKKKKMKEPAGLPPAGPWIHKLHLADNGIDGFGDGGSLASLICMRLIRQLIMNSKCLEELDLGHNLIGELGGQQILEGLEYRKEMKLGGCRVRTTHKMTPDTFNKILKLGSGLKKKMRRKGKKSQKRKK